MHTKVGEEMFIYSYGSVSWYFWPFWNVSAVMIWSIFCIGQTETFSLSRLTFTHIELLQFEHRKKNACRTELWSEVRLGTGPTFKSGRQMI